MLGAKPNIREATGPQALQLEEQAARITELEAYISALDGRRPIEMIDADDLFLFDGATGLGQSIWAGWALCDGRNGTPDLRARFIAGYDPGTAEYGIEATGGAANVTLTAAQSGLPEHSHTIPVAAVAGAGTSGGRSGTLGPDASTSGVTGGPKNAAEAHENRPPFYTLAFVKKIT